MRTPLKKSYPEYRKDRRLILMQADGACYKKSAFSTLR